MTGTFAVHARVPRIRFAARAKLRPPDPGPCGRGNCRPATAPLAVLALAGCSGPQSALDPQGPAAERIADLFWLFTATLTTIWLLVLLGLAVAIMRARRAPLADPLALDPAFEARARRVVGILVVLTAAIVAAFTILSYGASRPLA
ncbi:hypothetical protein [Propylenella binzhouense]|uniref:hypothetical protein n=1 Tax=Propylenella binzhouense TaxID=2555902 RepID=UPI001967A5F1|nr:hypothetical protein [Propylenella binzhouense]